MSENANHEGHRAGLRDRSRPGEAGLRSDEALLGLLLTYAIPQRDVQPLANSLMSKVHRPEEVLGAPPHDLCRLDGPKENSVVLLKMAGELLREPGSVTEPTTPVEHSGRGVRMWDYGTYRGK